MRASGVVLALTLVLAVPPAAGGIGAAWADDPDTPPSRTEVRDARDAVRTQARSVTTVQAELLAANQRLQETAVEAARASEAWNGARYRLEQARREAAAAGDRAGIAHDDVTTQRQAYTDAVVDSYQMAPELSAVVSIVQSDGIDSVVEQATTLSQTESAMDDPLRRLPGGVHAGRRRPRAGRRRRGRGRRGCRSRRARPATPPRRQPTPPRRRPTRSPPRRQG